MKLKLFNKKNTLASPKLRQRKRRVFEIKIVAALVLVAAFIFGLSAVSRLNALTINSIEGKGNAIITDHELAEIANKDMEGNFLLLFSKRNFLIYPKMRIRDDIAAAFPILSSVEVGLKGFTKLEIGVSERTPKALWCAYDRAAADPFTDSCYLLDAGGFVYLKAPEFKGNPYVKFYGKLEGDPLRQIYEPANLTKLTEFIDGVRKLGVRPLYLYSSDNGDYELHLNGGGKILFTEDNDLPVTIINLSTILQDNIPLLSKREMSIDYIDLRYGNRVFFKLNGLPQSAATSSSASQ